MSLKRAVNQVRFFLNTYQPLNVCNRYTELEVRGSQRILAEALLKVCDFPAVRH